MLITACGIKAHSRKGVVDSSARSYVIPFEYKDNLIYVNVVINGKSWRFLLDTGATNVIDQRIFDEGDFKQIDDLSIGDSNKQRRNLKIVKVPEIEIGGMRMQNSAAIVADLSTLLCYEVDGLIGSNLLAKFEVEIDYEKEELILSRDAVQTSYLEEFDIAIPFRPSAQRVPKLTIQWLKWQRGGVTFDTGSSGVS